MKSAYLPKGFWLFLVAICVVFLWAHGVFAQEVDTVVRAGPLVEFVLPIVLTVVTGLIGLFAAILTPILVKKFNLQNEEKIRGAIQTSLENTASGVINKLGAQAMDLEIDVRNPTVKAAIQRAIDGAKDSFETAGLTQEEIAKRVLEKISKQLTEAGVVTVDGTTRSPLATTEPQAL